MEKWFSKVAIVTGASSGIGKNIASRLVDHGVKVVGCGRNLDALLKVQTEITPTAKGEFTPFKCDVSKEDDVLSLFQFVKTHFHELSILINCAGFGSATSILQGKTADWKGQIDTNVLGLCMCSREAFALIHEREKSNASCTSVPGHIINISSIVGHTVSPSSKMHFYSATKFAVTAITEAIRQELREANSNIRVTQISPSLVETEFITRGFGGTFDSSLKTVIAQPLQSSDISDAIIFALSAEPRSAIHDIIIRSTTDSLH